MKTAKASHDAGLIAAWSGRAAVAAGAAVLLFSFALTLSRGGLASGGGSFSAASSGADGMPLGTLTVVSLVAVATFICTSGSFRLTGSRLPNLLGHFFVGQGRQQQQEHKERKEPLLKEHEEPQAKQSAAARAKGEELDDEADAVPPADRTPRRSPVWDRHGRRKLLEAQKRMQAWTGALALTGIEVLEGKEKEPHILTLKGPEWKSLVLDDEEELPLVALALRLDNSRLLLVFGEDDGECTVERVLTVQLSDYFEAVELAIALKALRGNADGGGGVFDWHSRPVDRLEKPPPAE